MANKVIIDVVARFVDNVTGKTKSASKSVDDIGKTAERAQKKIDSLGKKKVSPKLDVDDGGLLKKLKAVEAKVKKLGRGKTKVLLSAVDKATSVISKVFGKAKSFAGKTYSALLKLKDSNALATINKLNNGARNIAGKTWKAAVRVKDYATAPLAKIKNTLFSIKSLVLAITAGLAAKQFVFNPLSVADQYSSAKIGFQTLLGESAGQQMMDNLDAFAKATPFGTTDVITNSQKMLAMGWNAENIIDDMKTIGDAAAATGKGTQGLEQIVLALSQIKTKGRLSTEELNQLAEAGISAKRYIAEGLGYGTGDEGIAKMTKDLENGAIASDRALQALLAGMKEYEGIMDRTANETASGLASQLRDTFEINILRRWGQGLQDGARRGLGTVVDLLDDADSALQSFGDTVYEVGAAISNWAADKLQNAVSRITEITDSFEFKNASLGEKLKMLWDGVVVDPLKEWWENGGQQKTAETAGKIGSWLGKTLSSVLKGILGMTDVLGGGELESGAAGVAQSFAKGFVDNFDVSGITSKLVDAIGNVWNTLPAWGKLLVGGYVGGKALGGIGNAAGGLADIIDGASKMLGGFQIDSSTSSPLTYSGTGILGVMGKAGVGLGANTAGSAMLMGGAGIAGGVAAGATGIAAISDFYRAGKASKSGEKVEAEASAVGGLTKLGGVAAGAAIGSIFGPLGMLVGAGIGGVAGWIGGKKWGDSIRQAKYESEEMQQAMADSQMSAEELSQTFEKAKWENAKKHFGNIKLSMEEIERLADQIVWGDDMGTYEKFSQATKNAEANLESLKSAAADTDKWMWKASLGVKFNGDEIESIKESFNEYISSAKSFVENKHYEFTAAVDLLVDVNSEEGRSIIDSGNAFYGKIQEQLNELGSKLSQNVDIALEDGVITLDEQAEISNLQQQIADITNKIANAEQAAQMDLIKIKFGNGNLDIDSFNNLMSTMQTTIDERMQANDDAFVASVSNLKLQLSDGAISQEEYDKQLQTIVDGYTATIDNLRAEVENVELSIIGDAYSDELGDDAVEDLHNALQYAIDEGIDPVEIDSSKLFELLNVDSLSEETASNIKEMLSGTLDQLELLEVDGDLLLKIGSVETDGDVEEKVKSDLPETVEYAVGVNISGVKNVQNTIDVLSEDFGIPSEHAATVALLLTGSKELLNKIDVSQLAAEFGIPESQAKTIIEKLTGSKSIENRLTILASDFGIPDSISKTIKVNISAIKGKISNFVGNIFGGHGFRGGVFGGSSSQNAFYRGGLAGADIPGYSNGGIVRGGSRLITVAEEGSPEMVIPLSSQRRGRALKLWAQAGHMMDVPGFARGGLTNGGKDEGIRFNQYDTADGVGGQNVVVEVGGISVEIHVDATGDQSIAEAIQAQGDEIAETVAGILADALGAQYENTPTRGSAA